MSVAKALRPLDSLAYPLRCVVPVYILILCACRRSLSISILVASVDCGAASSLASVFLVSPAMVEHLWDDFYQQWGEGAEARYTSGEVTAICAAVYFLLLLSLYWGQNVCKGVSDVTAAGAIGAWVFVPETVAAPAPCVGLLLKPVVSNALLRAMTTCFGSICFGTLVVAVVQALVATLKQLKYSG
mmetsp:Transcript_42125/g.138618  ORF Transcript_42125/g.138618 Transcript_42125/m.138618 type:complete len:186 (+) Transcript_42125:360-917(+)